MNDNFGGPSLSSLPKKIIVGVWKDKLGFSSSKDLSFKVEGYLASIQKNSDLLIAVAPSPSSLHCVRTIAKELEVVCQDTHWREPGSSFLGTTSVDMLSELGIRYSLVGHSERRRFFAEDDHQIHRKLLDLQRHDIYPILAIGDDVTSSTERRQILFRQLDEGLGFSTSQPVAMKMLAIAYEPVWAISTWRSNVPLPSADEVEDMLGLVRNLLSESLGVNELPPILFGGSVGPSNAEAYFAVPECDGALVGGASLTEKSFLAVIDAGIARW